MIQVLRRIIIITVTLFSLTGLIIYKIFPAAALAAFTGLAWLLLERKKLPLLGTACFVAFCAIAGWSALLSMPFWFAAIVLFLALGAWDTDMFFIRLMELMDNSGGGNGSSYPVIKRHLARLSRVLGMGVLLVLPAAAIQIETGFWISILTGILIILGISRSSRFFKN